MKFKFSVDVNRLQINSFDEYNYDNHNKTPDVTTIYDALHSKETAK